MVDIKKTYKIKEFAKIVGVTDRTLRTWDKNNILNAFRTITNRWYYTEDQIAEVLGAMGKEQIK